MKTEERKQVEEDLIDSHRRWEQISKEGGSDPFWADGVNMNLERSHIIYYRRKLEEMDYFPDIYKKEVPPEVEDNYMARVDEIIQHAKESLNAYMADENYQYLKQNAGNISTQKAAEIYLGNVLGYVSGLRVAINQNDLITMRRHEHAARYMESFQDCRQKMAQIILPQSVESVRLSEDRNGQLCFGW